MNNFREIAEIVEVKPDMDTTDLGREGMEKYYRIVNDNKNIKLDELRQESIQSGDVINESNDEKVKSKPVDIYKRLFSDEVINGEFPEDNNFNKPDGGKIRNPESHGHWEGEPGNSKWIPDPDYIPPEKSRGKDAPYSNPNHLTWRQILEKYGIDGIPFKNGYPDFTEVAKGTVKIEGFETGGNTEKNRNKTKADIALAKQRGCTPEEVAKWRKENNYTWHECEDKETMMKVPNEIHANVPHNGGRSQKE